MSKNRLTSKSIRFAFPKYTCNFTTYLICLGMKMDMRYDVSNKNEIKVQA